MARNTTSGCSLIVSEWLQGVRVLDLRMCGLRGAEDVRPLADALRAPSCTLRTLHLDGNVSID